MRRFSLALLFVAASILTAGGATSEIPTTVPILDVSRNSPSFSSGIPVVAIDPSQLVFTDGITQRTFSIRNDGGDTLQWSLSADQAWIEIVPPVSGAGDAVVTLNVDPNLVPHGGQQTGAVTVDSNGGTAMVDVVFNPSDLDADAGFLGAYADPSGLNCGITDQVGGLLPVFIVHQNATGATASQFSAPLPACWAGALWLSDTPVFLEVGNSQVGIAKGYGTCQVSSSIHILTINIFVNGTGPTCCLYPVLPDPHLASGQIEIVDCDSKLLFAGGAPAFINANASCPCGTTPVEETTWGRVKAMYHDPGTFRPQKK